jgi:hypothetical protein
MKCLGKEKKWKKSAEEGTLKSGIVIESIFP